MIEQIDVDSMDKNQIEWMREQIAKKHKGRGWVGFCPANHWSEEDVVEYYVSNFPEVEIRTKR